jgi:transposase
MLSFSSRQRYFLYRRATDMRKGFNGLSGLVRDHISHELLSGDAFIFLNKRRDRVKILVWDRNGFVVWYKVLERGTFELPDAKNDTLEMSWTDIQLLLEGIEINSVKRRKRHLKPFSKTG